MISKLSIYETILYAKDLQAAEQFYTDVLGLKIVDQSDLYLAFECGKGVLLIFDPLKSSEPGRLVPSHGTNGAGHMAFAIDAKEIGFWLQRLQNKGVEIEKEVDWQNGGHSIYFRDPAGNSIELAPPNLWD
jgi:catechol 2,3-dioxygenase-like lactoylglutathione lyase family enzyme